MSKIKVLIFNPKITAGGITKILSDYIYNFSNDIEADLMTLEVSNNIYIRNQDNKLYIVGKSKNIFKRIYREYKLIKKGHYDVIHINGDFISRVIECISARLANVPKVIIHSHNDGSANNNFTRKFINKIVKKSFDFLATDFLACSNSSAEWLFSNKIIKNNNYTIVNNGIDINKFKFNQNIRKEIRNKFNLNDNYVIGFVGRLTYQKNPLFLIDVFYACKKIKDNVKLIVIGTGELENEMQTKIQKYHLEKDVIFLGNIDNTYKYYNAMDCFILPSNYEGLGIVNIEAQTSGLPCIVSDRVPLEAKVSENITFLPLEKGNEYWAKTIFKTRNIDRSVCYKEVLSYEYDIESTTRKLESIYYK